METREPTEELRRNVHGNEEIEWVVRPSATARFVAEGTWSLVGGLIGGAVLGGAVFLALTVLVPPLVVFAVPAGVVVFLAVLAWSLRAHVARWLLGTVEYAATDARIIRFGGVFGRGMSSVPLEGVQDAQYDVSTVEKFFDVGTVTLDTERGYETMSFPYTRSPASFAREVTSLARDARERGTPSLVEEGAPEPGEYEPGEGVVDEEPADGLADNVYPDETLLWVITPNKTARLARHLPGIVRSAVSTGPFVGAIAFGVAFALTRELWTAALVGAGVAGATFLLFVGASSFSYLRGATQYAATDRRFVEYENRFGKRFDAVPLAGVQDAEYGVSFTENLFDVGTVVLDTDRGYEGMVLSNVDNPPDVAREISRLAASDVADREAAGPEEVSVGEGVEPEAASGELEENLHADEEVAWVIRPDRRARLLADVVGSIPGTALGSLVVGGFVGVGVGLTAGPPTGVLAGVAVVLGLAVLSLYGPVKTYAFDETEYALTDDRLVSYSGAFGRELSGVPLAGIQDAEYRTTFVEDWFDVGDVTVDTHRGYEGLRLHAVANPSAVAREVSELANAYRLAEAEDGADASVGESPARGAATARTTSSGDAVPDVPPATARKRCTDCDAAIDATGAYCPECGAEQPSPAPSGPTRSCQRCGGTVDDGDAFCRHCGTADPLPEPETTGG